MKFRVGKDKRNRVQWVRRGNKQMKKRGAKIKRERTRIELQVTVMGAKVASAPV